MDFRFPTGPDHDVPVRCVDGRTFTHRCPACGEESTFVFDPDLWAACENCGSRYQMARTIFGEF